MANTLKVHGRSALRGIVTYTDASTGALVDLSAKLLFVEIAGGKLRRALLPGNAPTERILHLTRDEVATLPTSPVTLTILDETIPGDETVIGERAIQRIGYVLK